MPALIPSACRVSALLHGRRALGAWLVGLAIGVIGCVDASPPPASCAAPAVEVDLTLTASALSPADPAACRGQVMTLRIEASVEGVLHVHGYEAELTPIDVGPGAITEVTFDATRSGQFPMELHTEDDSDGSTVGILTVHER